VWPRIPTLHIQTASRISLNRLLKRQFEKLEAGLVLDIGAKSSSCREVIPHTHLLKLDIDSSNNPDICCDIHDFEWESNYFDTVVSIEVLEHLRDPERAISQIRRVLKVDGVAILSTRFLHHYHPDPEDHYRFTWDSLSYLFREFSEVEIFHHGNKAQAFWALINSGGRSRVFLNILNPIISRFESARTQFPLGFVVWARK